MYRPSACWQNMGRNGRRRCVVSSRTRGGRSRRSSRRCQSATKSGSCRKIVVERLVARAVLRVGAVIGVVLVAASGVQRVVELAVAVWGTKF